MTVGSDAYSDLYFRSLVEKLRRRKNCCNALILLLAVILLFIAGLSNLLATQLFDKFDIKDSHAAILSVLGGIYIIESCILTINFFCCRNTKVILFCIILSILSLCIGIYRMISLDEWHGYYVIFPIIADLIIIPILMYRFCKGKQTMDQQQFVLLEDNNNNQIIIPKYDSDGKENKLLSNYKYNEKQLDTAQLDLGEDDIDSNLLSTTESNVNGPNEDDEKAEFLMDTPGGNIGELLIENSD
eukprot:161964_1